jgi:NADPH:quinone reductase-like Zn-dependent oxidoreductase
VPCIFREIHNQKPELIKMLLTRIYYSLKIIETPRPDPEDNQVVVKMLCAALNRRDVFARQRLYPGAAGNVPILADGVGLVIQCGSSVAEEQWLGKRVILTPARG